MSAKVKVSNPSEFIHQYYLSQCCQWQIAENSCLFKFNYARVLQHHYSGYLQNFVLNSVMQKNIGLNLFLITSHVPSQVVQTCRCYENMDNKLDLLHCNAKEYQFEYFSHCNVWNGNTFQHVLVVFSLISVSLRGQFVETTYSVYEINLTIFSLLLF